ncbi:hypothetical protein GM676_24000 [Duganella radicis]|uniref:Uncharacterized protein n=2 Tax=Duganella radicis TaxID=551988 RepID=A0A6L6PNC3_9BURK|nr:hypothetical protein [Duganella radicis]
MGLFSRRRKQATDTGGLGTTLIALRLEAGDVAPAQSTVVVFNAAGHARRMAAGKVLCEQGEMAFCFHPGPYTVDLIPFAAAPEWGLRLRFVVDAANPRVPQQRFDLFLYSETAGRLMVADFGVSVELALQAELAQGALDLPPCTTLEEWHAFRAGLNQLMYSRYGVTVDDCVPVDLGEQIDYATILQTRAQQEAAAHTVAAAMEQTPAAMPPAGQSANAGIEHAPAAGVANAPIRLAPAAASAAGQTVNAAAGHVAAAAAPVGKGDGTSDSMPTAARPGGHAAAAVPSAGQAADAVPRGGPVTAAAPPSVRTAEQDARALRRLFLELPALSAELRLLALPEGLPVFQQHQALLLRLGMAALNVNTMPSLAWSAPDQPLAAIDQARRATQTLIAQVALDEAWSLLARLQLADPQQWPQLLDEADRICANLETGLSLRRSAHIPRMEPSL